MGDPLVLHVDNHLLAVAKPAGLPVVPDASGDESLLEQARDWVRREFAKPGEAFLAVVHRLDRPVSGVVLFARTSKGASRLSEQFRLRSVEKVYWGVAAGEVRGEAGELEQWLVKDPEKNRVRAVASGRSPEAPAPEPRRAFTTWRVLRRAAGATLLELHPATGRPHQLRLASQALGAPLCGDLKYGAASALPDRSIALHALALTVDHPTRAERSTFRCAVPGLDVWQIARDHEAGGGA